MKYVFLFILGILIGSLLFTDGKAEFVNEIAVRLYIKTDTGKSFVRKMLHDSCYFTGQYLELSKKLPVNMSIMDREYCWDQANKTLKYWNGDR